MKSSLVKLGVILIGLAIFGYAEMWGAECAWVLWEKEMREGQPYDCKILEAYPKYDQCEEAQKDWLEQQKEGFEKIKKRMDPLNRITTIIATPFIIIVNYEDGSQRVFETQCLPDTIDPRK